MKDINILVLSKDLDPHLGEVYRITLPNGSKVLYTDPADALLLIMHIAEREAGGRVTVAANLPLDVEAH